MVLTQQTKQQPSEDQVNQIVQSVLQNPEAQESKQIMEAYKKYKSQQGTQMAKLGAKLAYYKKLKGSCPEGQEMVFFKSGGKMDCKCQDKMQKGGDIKKKSNAVDDFKNKRKDSKSLPKKACGSKLKKKK